MPTGFPSPHDDDSEDVAWGLTTGSALWKQGERYDAIVWLKRAVDAATEAGQSARADELNRAATELIASLAAPAPAPLAPAQSAPPAPAPLAPLTPAPAPLTPAPASSASPLPVQQIIPKLAPPPSASPPPAPAASTAPSPPKPPPVPARKGPTPPKPPPPPKSRLPAPTGAAQSPSSAPRIELPPPRAPMPSVTTSAPPLEELTSHAPAEELPHPAPPPPTISPDIEPEARPAPAPAAVAAIAGDVDVATDDVLEPPAYKSPIPAEEPEPEAAAITGFAATSEPEPAAPEPEPAAPEPEPASEPEPAPEPEPARESAPPAEAPFFLGALEASGELTDAQREALYRSVTIESIGADEEVKVSGLALVIDGLASVQATISDVPAGTLKAGEALYAKCSIPDAMSLRLVAEADPTKVALWDLEAVEAALSGSSTLLEGLMRASDRIQAIAGCTMGPLGDRLDEGLRASAIERLEVRVLQPDDVVASAGLPVPGIIIVGIGSVELEQDGGPLGPGDFLFATEVLGGEAAPTTARAGAKGAIIFFGARALAQDLLVSCPPLLEIFAGM